MNEIYHYGVKGMKWGIRKSDRDSRGDYTIEKGSKFGRVALTPEDPTYDNKKYLSTNVKDQKKWENYLGGEYKDRGRPTFNIGYTNVNDLKVLSATNAGQKFCFKMMDDPDFAAQAMLDTHKTYSKLGSDASENPNDPGEQISMNVAFQTKTGKAFVDHIMKQGYSAMEDQHGRNVAKDPIIVFDPDKNLQKTTVDTTKYWRYKK